MLLVFTSILFIINSPPQIRPRFSSRLRGVSTRTTCSIQLSDWRLSPPGTSSLGLEQAFFLFSFLQRSYGERLPAIIGGSVRGCTYNFFSCHNKCLRVADTAFI